MFGRVNKFNSDETAIPDTRFEAGKTPFARQDKVDWEQVKEMAKSNRLEELPPDIYVRCYNQLKRIAMDNLKPLAIIKTVNVFWGRTGTGKSMRAWEEATITAYGKDPRTKWWCGYTGQQNVVIDEFRGDIGIAHMLRWLDRYPVSVETKGGCIPLAASTIWITSNLDPRMWYADLDSDTRDALIRRLNITHYN